MKMFKKGQLIRSEYTGMLWVVREWPLCETPSGTPQAIGHNGFVLIGNNYRAKQKCSR